MSKQKKINDPIHGAMEFSDLEIELINTKPFQRLRNIGQLAFVSHVFPSATYTRFAHSLGVCHVTGLIIGAMIDAAPDGAIKEHLISKRAVYRIAALLHDIGHYPYSHVTEHAERTARDEASEEMLNASERIRGEAGTDQRSAPRKSIHPINHERLGREILLNDPEIKAILAREGLDPHQIAFIFNGGSSITAQEDSDFLMHFPYFAIVSSDVDADRIDYLLRNSYFSGLPYGSIDNKYLVRQFLIVDDDEIAIDIRALHAVDHFLISRYYDYAQFIFHKTSTGFEKMLQSIISYLSQTEKIQLKYHSAGIEDFIKNYWLSFDDAAMITHIRETLDRTSHSEEMSLENYELRRVRHYANSLLWRKPSKILVNYQFLGNRKQAGKGQPDSLDRRAYVLIVRSLEQALIQASNFFVEQGKFVYLFIWNSDRPHFTSPAIEYPSSTDRPTKQKAVKIRNNGNGRSALLTSYANSLSQLIDSKCLFTIRAYATSDEVELEGDTLFELSATVKKNFIKNLADNIELDKPQINEVYVKDGDDDNSFTTLEEAIKRIEDLADQISFLDPPETSD
ncbi:HD domain-containing protein [Deinococcus yunweiensis]|uniref:HD domain-containing protein n=1 Tax=Deinococcus yunweiensis TaxID=367282 RepID=UPI00398ECE6D